MPDWTHLRLSRIAIPHANTMTVATTGDFAGSAGMPTSQPLSAAGVKTTSAGRQQPKTTCPIASDYRLHLLHLPCHQSLDDRELDWMIAAIQKLGATIN